MTHDPRARLIALLTRLAPDVAEAARRGLDAHDSPNAYGRQRDCSSGHSG